jgi:hypothetical protein
MNNAQNSNYNKIEKILKKTKQLVLLSTSHGLPNAFRTNRPFFKKMWICLFITSTMFGLFAVYQSVNTYLHYEIVTKIDVITEAPTNFPTITLINLKNRKSNTSLNEIMIYCNFNFKECNENDFDMIVDKFGFVSYRFKHFKSYTPGLQYGLQLLIDTANVTCSKCYLDGLRLIVHNQTADPGYYSGGTKSGFILAPGFNHEVVIKRTFSSKLGLPFNNCIKNVKSLDSHDSEIYKYMLNNTQYDYTQKDCFDYCMGTELNKHFNVTNKIDHWLNLYKTYSFNKFWGFYSKIKNKIEQVCTPMCPLECDSIKYDASISFTKFSNEEFEALFRVNGSQSVTSIDIYYENLEYTSISQLPKMNVIDLISNIGSNLSLFIGISFISFAEIIEILGEILMIFFEKNKKEHHFKNNFLKKRNSI